METYTGLLRTVWDILSQKWQQRQLPHASDIGELIEGQTVVITGPTSGIGEQIATQLANRGGTVILACRSLQKGNALKQRLEQVAQRDGLSKPRLEVHELDVADLESIRAFADSWLRSGRSINCLINNAGIFSLGARRTTTQDGFEAHMGTNFLGPFLLTVLLLPAFQAAGSPSRPARIIFVSSILHWCGRLREDDMHLQAYQAYSSLRAYSASKLAQVAFAAELRRRLPQDGSVVALACHPGECTTEIIRTLPRFMQRLYHFILPPLLLTPENGALSTLFYATGKLSGAGLRLTDPDCCYIGSGCSVQTPAGAALDAQKAAWLWEWACCSIGLDPLTQPSRS